MRSCNTIEAKAHLSRLLDEVEAGGEVLILRRGAPVARLVPAGSEPAAAERVVELCERLRAAKSAYVGPHVPDSDAATVIRQLREER